MPKLGALTQLQEKFVLSYLRCGDYATAAREAGCKSKDFARAGYMLSTRPAVQQRIKELRDRAADKVAGEVAFNETDYFERLRWALDRAREGNPFMSRTGDLERDKDGSVVRKPDLHAFAKLLEQMGKTMALFTDKQRIEGEFEKLSEAELLQKGAELLDDPLLSSHFIQMMLSREGTARLVIERLVDDPQTRGWILERIGSADEGAQRAEASSSDAVSAVSEAEGVSRRRVH